MSKDKYTCKGKTAIFYIGGSLEIFLPPGEFLYKNWKNIYTLLISCSGMKILMTLPEFYDTLL